MITTKRNILIVLSAFLVALSAQGTVLADKNINLTQDKQNITRQNCISSQMIILGLQKRDEVSRINRGRAYDQLSRQIVAFNSRFVASKISAPDLVSLADDLQTDLDHFRSDYDRYYDDLSNAIKIDCKNKPVDFYQLVIKSKDDRATVGADIVLLDELLGKYRIACLHYQSVLQSDSPPGVNP
ncbi:MAG TPA: hypothetical protein VNX65_00275 [Patescibacteria group bacterium]|jgi:hypothetical protein|nr:hypothetical protein [Patescibacteria group bacterium]